MKGIDHVTIIVKDVAAAARSYEMLLGRAPSWRGEHTELGTRAVLFSVGNTLLELVGPIADAVESEGMRTLLDERGEGAWALAFLTDDAQRTSNELRAKGVRAAPPAEGEARGVDGSVRTYRAVELSPRETRGLSVLVVERADTDALRGAHQVDASSVEALDMISLFTSQPAAAITFYGEKLGIRLALDQQVMGTRMLFFRTGGITLEVIENAATGDKDTFYGLVYRVRDINAAHTRIAAHGFAVSEVRKGNKPGTEVFTVRDGTCGVKTLIIRDPARDA